MMYYEKREAIECVVLFLFFALCFSKVYAIQNDKIKEREVKLEMHLNEQIKSNPNNY